MYVQNERVREGAKWTMFLMTTGSYYHIQYAIMYVQNDKVSWEMNNRFVLSLHVSYHVRTEWQGQGGWELNQVFYDDGFLIWQPA